MLRRHPTDYLFFLGIAMDAKLSNPEGRALYAVNRQQSGWRLDGYGEKITPLELMTKAKQATADRWLAHWMAGGSIRSLKETQEQWNARVGVEQKRRADELRAMRAKRIPRCAHEWQEQPGEPPVDVCSSCGATRR